MSNGQCDEKFDSFADKESRAPNRRVGDMLEYLEAPQPGPSGLNSQPNGSSMETPKSGPKSAKAKGKKTGKIKNEVKADENQEKVNQFLIWN